MVRQQTPFRFTEREMDIAKGTDLPDLLTHLGYQVRRVGSYYTTREMDSLRIKERRTWRRYSNQTGGDAIAFLQEFCGKDFREAVNYLLEFNGHRARASPVPHQPSPAKKERPAFALPSAAPDQRHVFAYLRKRGIAPQVIQSFIQAGLSWNWLRHLGSYRPGGKGMETDERCQYPGGTKNTDRIYLKCRNQLPCGNGHTKTHL